MSDEVAGEATTGTPARPGVFETWRQTPREAKALLAGVFVSKLAAFLQIFLVLFLTHRGFSGSQAGWALGVYGAGAVLGTAIGGWLSDRLSPRSATVISMMGSAVLIASLIYIKYYPLILLAVLLVSAVGQFYRPAAQSMITQLTPPDKLVMVTAMYMLCVNLGTTVAPLIGVALAEISYNLLFWAEALAVLAFGVIALVALPKPDRSAAAAAAKAKAEEADPPIRGRYIDVLRDYRYSLFMVAFFLQAVVYVQYTAALPLAIKAAGQSIWWYGALITMNAVICATCQMIATKFVQGWPIRVVQLTGFTLVALGYAMYAIDMLPVFLILGTLFWTLSEIVGVPTMFAYPGMIAPPHLRGRYIGAMQTMFGLGATVGPVLGVLLFEHIGQRVWIWMTLIEVVATVIGAIGIRRATAPGADDTPTPESVVESPSGLAVDPAD
ncbi:MFS transporter [Kribbella sp. NBC_00382]|uniref:MFS transporter n=1 Tax=Kribbella sp. NBC_00382 TaxID=2975967 RepID=UPI002E1B7C1D